MIPIVDSQSQRATRSLRAKIRTVVKLTLVLLFFFNLQVSANANAQEITIIKKNVRLTEIFATIEQQTSYLFFYDKDLIEKIAPIDIRLKNATLDQALSACLKNQNLKYSIVRNTIVIRTN